MDAHPLTAISRWLAHTPLSQTLQNVDWLIPAIQSVHILAVGMVIAAALMIGLTLLGRHAREQAPPRSYARFAPVLYWGIPVLLLTGSLMVAAEPDRSLPNPVFQLKMLLVLLAASLTVVSGRVLRRAPASVVGTGRGRRGLLAVASFGAWIGVVFAGRWIAYSMAR